MYLRLKKILAFSVGREVVVIALSVCLKDKLGLCSINCYNHTKTGNCSASLRVLINSLRVVFAMIGNSLLAW